MFTVIFGTLVFLTAVAGFIVGLGGFALLNSGRIQSVPPFMTDLFWKLPNPVFLFGAFAAVVLGATVLGLVGSLTLWLGIPLSGAALYFTGKQALVTIKALKAEEK